VVHTTSISKKYEAHAEIKIKIHSVPFDLSCKIAESVCAAMKPEVKLLNCGEKIEIKSLGTIVDIIIHAKDIVSLRAVVGSYMRLVQTAYGCLCA
jgi:tRNA threonylcarbamoyladenosine modification (KEOPS) complex  Pcc1 subunit